MVIWSCIYKFHRLILIRLGHRYKEKWCDKTYLSEKFVLSKCLHIKQPIEFSKLKSYWLNKLCRLYNTSDWILEHQHKLHLATLMTKVCAYAKWTMITFPFVFELWSARKLVLRVVFLIAICSCCGESSKWDVGNIFMCSLSSALTNCFNVESYNSFMMH